MEIINDLLSYLSPFSFFDLISLFYAYRGLQLIYKIYSEWQGFLAPPFTFGKKQMGEQASFFVSVPLSVLVHEFGHALFVWLYGGQVVEFGYRIFWGYVLPDRRFTDPQEFVISLAGTLGSLLFGFVVWVLLRKHAATSLRYFGMRTLRFQVYFSLIYYPLFAAFLGVGDWRTIYNFNATPLLSGVTAVFHLALLILFWLGDRFGFFEQPAFHSIAAENQYHDLLNQATTSPDQAQTQLQLVQHLRQGGARNRAMRRLKALITKQPHNSTAHFQRGLLLLKNSGEISQKGVQDLKTALALGLSEPGHITAAHQIIGHYHLKRRHDGQLALNHFSQALATAVSNQDYASLPPTQQKLIAQIHGQRAQAYRRLKQVEQARQDLQQAITIAQRQNDGPALQHYQSELGAINNR